jgi:hypothetical protein
VAASSAGPTLDFDDATAFLATFQPEPEKGGRGKSKTKNMEETSSFTHKRFDWLKAAGILRGVFTVQ